MAILNLFTKPNEKTTSGAGITLGTNGTVGLNNNVNLFNVGKTNTPKTSSLLNKVSSNKGIVTNKLSYDILKGMQNGTIDRNNLFNSIETARKNYIEEPLARQRATVDYLQSEDFANTKRTSNWTGDPSVDYYMHPQNMTPEGWIDRKLALDKGNTELAKQIEEQDKAKRVQNWNDWWNSEAEVKKRQERTDKYNKEQEKKQKEYDARIPESIKKIQKFADETKNDIAMQGAREYVKELTQTMGENEIADYLDNYLYIQGFASGTKSGWWSDYSAYDDLKEDLKALIEENGGVVDIENASKLAKYIKDATGYELPADGVGETLWRGAKSLGKSTAKGITKVGDSVFTGWSMAYTGAKNAITGSNDKYRQYNSWDDLNAELNGEIYRKEYKDPSLQNAWSNALSGGAGLAQVAQTVYFPVINYVFDTAGETQRGRDLFSNKLAGTAIGTVIGAVASRGKTFWGKVGTTGAGTFIGSVPQLVDMAVEEYAGNMSEEDKENLKGLITDGFFTALGVKETGNNYKPIQSKVQTVKNTAEVIKNVPKTVETIKDSRAVKQATKGTEQATVSKEYDPTRVANANKNIDTRKIKTYEQWGNALKDRVTKASREVDSMLSKDKVYDLKDFNQKTTSGKTEVNYVKNALEDMKKFYEKNRSYEKLEKIEDILSGKEKLSELDVNNLAREYGIEFDAWLKNGELSSSANKQGYETTRMGIKQWLRENTEGGKKAETLDREISDIKNLEKIVDRRTKNVTSEEIRGKESVLGKVVRGATTVAGTAVGTALAPGYGSIGGVILGKVVGNILTNVGKKQGKSDLDMQKSLNKNLKKIQKLSERLKKKEITEKQVEREIEDLLSSEKQRSKFLKKKTKTEAKKLSEPKVKGLLTEGKKALPEGKKLLKKGEKTDINKKPVGGKNPQQQASMNSITDFQKKANKFTKIDEKGIPYYEKVDGTKIKYENTENLSNRDFTRMAFKTDAKLEAKNKSLVSMVDDIQLGKRDSGVLTEIPGEIFSDGKARDLSLDTGVYEKSYIKHGPFSNENLVATATNYDYIIRNTRGDGERFDLIKRIPGTDKGLVIGGKKVNGASVVTHFEPKSNIDAYMKNLEKIDDNVKNPKKPKKLEAKKLKTPKKESEILNGKTVGGESYEVLVENYRNGTLNSKEGLIDLYIKGLIKKGNLEFENPNMIESLKTQLIKRKDKNGGNTSYTKTELIQKISNDLGISKRKTFGEKVERESKLLKKEAKPLKKVEEVKVEEKIETLPKDVSIESEAKQMGNKRIAPDRVKWQQLKYEDGVSNMQDSVNKLANYLQSKKRTVEAIGGGIDSYLRLMPTGRYNSVSGFLEKIGFKSKQGKEFKTLVQNIVEADGNKTILNEIGKHLYITRVKGDISKGYQYPQEVVDKIPGAKKAINDRERYQKGLDTSFSAKDARIDYSDVDKIGAGIKSQDGKQITKEQRENIVKGIQDFEKVFGVDLKQLAKDEGIVYVDLHGGNPFLNKAGGQYTTLTNADGTVNKSVSVGGSEIYRYKDANGEWQTEKVNTTMAHELTHFLDLYSEKRLLTDKEVSELRKTMIKDGKTWGKGKSYWNDPAEITARAFEEYFGMKKGGEGGTRGKGVKFTEHGYYWNEKNFKEIVEPIVEKAVKNFKDRMEVKIEDLPF